MLSRSRKHGKDDVAFEILGRLNKCAADDPTIADEVREIKRVCCHHWLQQADAQGVLEQWIPHEQIEGQHCFHLSSLPAN